RGECRVISGVTVVTTLVCFVLFSHARLRAHWAPGIPCALFSWANGFCKNSGASCRGNAVAYLKLGRRHCEERLVRRSSTSEGGSDEAIHSSISRQHGLLRGACHRARVRATRWLAMTVPRRATPQLSSPGLTGRSSIPRRQ